MFRARPMNSASLSTWPHTYKPSTGSVHGAERVRPNRTSYKLLYVTIQFLSLSLLPHPSNRRTQIVALGLTNAPFYYSTTNVAGTYDRRWRLLPLGASRVVCRNQRPANCQRKAEARSLVITLPCSFVKVALHARISRSVDRRTIQPRARPSATA